MHYIQSSGSLFATSCIFLCESVVCCFVRVPRRNMHLYKGASLLYLQKEEEERARQEELARREREAEERARKEEEERQARKKVSPGLHSLVAFAA